MKKNIILAFLVLLMCATVYGGGYDESSARTKAATTAPTPPKEPAFTLIDIPTTGMVIISQKEWNALEQYFTAFDNHVSAVEAELAKMKKPSQNRPANPRMNLNTAKASELPAAVTKVSKETYMIMSAENRNNLNQNLQAMRDYIKTTQAMF